MRVFSTGIVVNLIAVFFVFCELSIAGDKTALQKPGVSPHSDAGDCTICHVASAETLRSWFSFGSTKRELKDDLNKICQNCHAVEPTHAGGFIGVGKGHATGNKPDVNHRKLPLAADGTITCATTCHNIHVISEDKRQQRKHLRLPFNSLCVSCHDK